MQILGQDQGRRRLREVGGNCLIYLKREEGKQRLKNQGQAGSRGGCLKKMKKVLDLPHRLCQLKNGFWFVSKIVSANLCKPVHHIKNYSISICLFEPGKSTKIWISWKQKQIFRWNQKTVFEGLSFGEKINTW